MDQSSQIRQIRRDPEPVGDHQNIFVVAHRRALSMGTTEQHRARNFGPAVPIGLGVTQKLSGKPLARLNEELQGVLLPIRPRRDYERMAL